MVQASALLLCVWFGGARTPPTCIACIFTPIPSSTHLLWHTVPLPQPHGPLPPPPAAPLRCATTRTCLRGGPLSAPTTCR